MSTVPNFNDFCESACIKLWGEPDTVAEVAALGVRRISLGCGLARAAWGGFMRAVKLITEDGKFDGLADAASWAELNRLFAANRKARART